MDSVLPRDVKTCVKKNVENKGASEKGGGKGAKKKLKFGGPHLGVVAKEADGII